MVDNYIEERARIIAERVAESNARKAQQAQRERVQRLLWWVVVLSLIVGALVAAEFKAWGYVALPVLAAGLVGAELALLSVHPVLMYGAMGASAAAAFWILGPWWGIGVCVVHALLLGFVIVNK